MTMTLAFAAFAAIGATAGTAWRDPAPVGSDSIVVNAGSGAVRIDPLAENLFRVRVARGGEWTESAMNRYGVLARDWPACPVRKSADRLQTAAADVSAGSSSSRTVRTTATSSPIRTRRAAARG